MDNKKTDLREFLFRPFQPVMGASGTFVAFVGCAIAALVMGGLVWIALCGIFNWPFVGDGRNEPHGHYAFIWGFVTALSVIVCAVSACYQVTWSRHEMISRWLAVIVLYAIFGGIAVLFYDLGFRGYIESTRWRYELKEIVIVLLWSGFIMGSTYLFLSLLNHISPELVAVQPLQWRWLLLAIVFPVLIVGGWLFVKLPALQTDQVRGLIAGGVLRISLFLLLFISISTQGYKRSVEKETPLVGTIYDTEVVRELLGEAFSDDELARQCFDHFYPVYNRFGSGMTKDQKIALLLEHCYRQQQIKCLLDMIKENNPNQYARFEPRLVKGDNS